MIAYVSTNYANRAFATVKADIDKYRALYNVDGFFLDEMQNTSDPTAIAYYGQVYSYIQSLDSSYRVVGNPGTNTLPAYINTPGADTVITFESNTGYSTSTPSSWTTNYATRRFSNIPYEIGSVAAMQAAVTRGANNRVGYLYVTDDGADGNPWDRLPTYWADELAAVRAITPTWNAAASGNWNTATNWTTSAVPNGIGAEAFLLGAIASPQTIYSNSPLTLGALVFNSASRYDLTGAGSLTLDAAVEGALIDVRRGSHTINLPLTLNDPTTASVSEGATLNIADPLIINVGASLTKSGAGTLLITSTITNAAALSITAGLVELQNDATLASLTMSDDASIDIGVQSLALLKADPSTIRGALQSAYADGDWTGAGLTSSAADALHGIAYADGNGATRLRVAAFGDATLDGAVDFEDLLTIAAADGSTWTGGDFNYDASRDAADLALMQVNYVGNFAADWALAQSLVPEPTAGIALLLLARRRR